MIAGFPAHDPKIRRRGESSSYCLNSMDHWGMRKNDSVVHKNTNGDGPFHAHPPPGQRRQVGLPEPRLRLENFLQEVYVVTNTPTDRSQSIRSTVTAFQGRLTPGVWNPVRSALHSNNACAGGGDSGASSAVCSQPKRRPVESDKSAFSATGSSRTEISVVRIQSPARDIVVSLERLQTLWAVLMANGLAGRQEMQLATLRDLPSGKRILLLRCARIVPPECLCRQYFRPRPQIPCTLVCPSH